MIVVIAALVYDAVQLIGENTKKQPVAEAGSTVETEKPEEASSTVSPSPVTNSLNQEADGNWYVNADPLLIIANKTYKLADGYAPADLVEVPDPRCSSGCEMRAVTAEAWNEMKTAASKEGITLTYSSSFRDEAYQASLYNSYVARDGSTESADRYSSRPGYSDHQTGLAIDIMSASDPAADLNAEAYENTEEGQWLLENAWKYGFVLRYPKGKEDITGYEYESWHYRYIGKEYAEAVHEAGENESMEEFFGFRGGVNYPD